MPQRQPILLIVDTARRELSDVDANDTVAVLRAASWSVHVTGAACEQLALCGPAEYELRWRRIRSSLADAVTAGRASPSLRGTRHALVEPSGSPDDTWDASVAAELAQAIVETAQTLQRSLTTAAGKAHRKADRRACRVIAAIARTLADTYESSVVERVPHEVADGISDYLPARTLTDIRSLVDTHRHWLQTVDPTNTAAAWTAAWYGTAVLLCLSGFLANRDPEHAVLHDNAAAPFAHLIESLETAPSLPANVHPIGLDTEGNATHPMMDAAHRGLTTLVLALNTLLSRIATDAADQADQAAARDATRRSSEIGDCFEGRLRTFLR